MHLETRPSGKTQISFGTFCRSHADTFVLILREGFLAFCVSNVHWLARLFHTQTRMRLHAHTYTPHLAQQVRMFHKLQPAHQGYVCVHYHWCWVRVCQSAKMLTVKDMSAHTVRRPTCRLISVVSKESPWQRQNETMACGREDMCVRT